MGGHVLRQRRQRPQLGRQPHVFGLPTGQIDHPSLGFIGDLRRSRPVVAVTQAGHHPGRQRLVDALVDRRPRHPQGALNLRRRLAIGVRKQHLRSFDLALRRNARAGQFTQHRTLLRAQRQRRSPNRSCHASLHKESLERHDPTRKWVSKGFTDTMY
jgi:hypothetical protein